MYRELSVRICGWAYGAGKKKKKKKRRT